MLRHVHRALAPLGIVLALAFAPAAAAQGTAVEGSIVSGTIRPDAGSCPGVLCGSGTFAPFGAAEFTYVPTSFEQVSRSCFDVTAILQITLIESGDTLDLATASTACFPGNSFNAPKSPGNWGNPVTDAGTWTVDSGTGVFAGASGEGTFAATGAGAALHGELSGELVLADN